MTWQLLQLCTVYGCRQLYYFIQAMNIRFCIRSQVGVQIPSCRMPTLATEWAWLGHFNAWFHENCQAVSPTDWELGSVYSLDWTTDWTHPKWCKVPFPGLFQCKREANHASSAYFFAKFASLACWGNFTGVSRGQRSCTSLKSWQNCLQLGFFFLMEAKKNPSWKCLY